MIVMVTRPDDGNKNQTFVKCMGTVVEPEDATIHKEGDAASNELETKQRLSWPFPIRLQF